MPRLIDDSLNVAIDHDIRTLSFFEIGIVDGRLVDMKIKS